ncbi:MAG TPA: peptidylprolyl isomerase [Candidatus Polarisedimenticolia bacterium]|nr:peptidylprolyl isomerase [Candidatus Polarisedimenticolia bacterium]
MSTPKVPSRILLCGLAALIGAAASPARLPVFAGKEAVATVNGEPVTLEDLARHVGSLHEGIAEPAAPVKKADPSRILQRMIDARLVAQEARRIGLDQLPDIKKRLDDDRLDLVKSLVVRDAVKDVPPPSPAEIDQRARESVRDLRVESVLFTREEDARAFVAAVRGGGDFGALARAAFSAGKAREPGPAASMKPDALRPEVADPILALKPGGVTEPLRITEGFTVAHLLEIRYPVEAADRAAAERDLLEPRRQARLEQAKVRMRRDYFQVDQGLLAKLDYEAASPGLAALRKDTRVLARVKGDPPVLVKDLTAEVEKNFYHGVQEAIERKRVNESLPRLLDRVLMERATLLEAKRLKIESTAEFRDTLREREDERLFEAFLQKVVHPDIHLTDDELQRYYAAHAKDYASPEMMRLEGIAFGRREDAQSAFQKLQKGADMKWMQANAPGRADREHFPEMADLGNGLVVTSTFPEPIRNAVAGATGGDLRLASSPAGPHYVLAIRQVVPASPRPFDSVRSDIASLLYRQKRQAALDEWTAKLRAASVVKTFADGKTLASLLQEASGKRR